MKRLCLDVEPDECQNRYKSVEPKKPSGIDLLLKGNSLEGIIHYLTVQCGGNVHDKGVVEITGGPVVSSHPSYALKNIADLTADSYFYSDGSTQEHTVCYDFKEKSIIPSGYSIRSRYDGGPGDCNIQSWVIETSNDGSSWTEIDRKQNCRDLDDGNVTKMYNVNTSSSCRYIRLRQTGPGTNSYYPNQIVLSSFEIFGTLLVP